MVTRKDIRVVNMETGRNKKIFVVCGDEEEISVANSFTSGILLGNSKG